MSRISPGIALASLGVLILLSCQVEGKCKCVDYSRDWYVVVSSFISGLILAVLSIGFLRWFRRRCPVRNPHARTGESQEQLGGPSGEMDTTYEEVDFIENQGFKTRRSFQIDEEDAMSSGSSQSSQTSLVFDVDMHGKSRKPSHRNPEMEMSRVYSDCSMLEDGESSKKASYQQPRLTNEHIYSTVGYGGYPKENYMDMSSGVKEMSPEVLVSLSGYTTQATGDGSKMGHTATSAGSSHPAGTPQKPPRTSRPSSAVYNIPQLLPQATQQYQTPSPQNPPPNDQAPPSSPSRPADLVTEHTGCTDETADREHDYPYPEIGFLKVGDKETGSFISPSSLPSPSTPPQEKSPTTNPSVLPVSLISPDLPSRTPSIRSSGLPVSSASPSTRPSVLPVSSASPSTRPSALPVSSASPDLPSRTPTTRSSVLPVSSPSPSLPSRTRSQSTRPSVLPVRSPSKTQRKSPSTRPSILPISFPSPSLPLRTPTRSPPPSVPPKKRRPSTSSRTSSPPPIPSKERPPLPSKVKPASPSAPVTPSMPVSPSAAAKPSTPAIPSIPVSPPPPVSLTPEEPALYTDLNELDREFDDSSEYQHLSSQTK